MTGCLHHLSTKILSYPPHSDYSQTVAKVSCGLPEALVWLAVCYLSIPGKQGASCKLLFQSSWNGRAGIHALEE